MHLSSQKGLSNSSNVSGAESGESSATESKVDGELELPKVESQAETEDVVDLPKI